MVTVSERQFVSAENIDEMPPRYSNIKFFTNPVLFHFAQLPFSYTWQKLKDVFKDAGKISFSRDLGL